MAVLASSGASALKNSLKMAYTGAALRYAFVPNGGSGILIVAKSIPPAQVSEAKKQAGGGQVWQGRCVGEDGTLFFEIDKEPPGNLLGQFKKCLKEDGGQTWPVELRVQFDPAAVPGEAPPAREAGAPPQDSAAIQFKDRLKKLLAEVVKASAAKHPAAAEMKLAVSEAQTLGGKGDFAGAGAALDRLDKMLHAPARPTHPPEDAGKAAKVKEALESAGHALKTALKAHPANATVLASLYAQATAHAKPGGDADKALAVLAQLKKVLDGAQPPSPPANGKPAKELPPAPKAATGAKVQYAQLLLAWDAAKKKVHSQLQVLEQKIIDDFKELPTLPLMKEKVRDLDKVLNKLDKSLQKALDAALNAADAEKPPHHKDALAAIERYRQYLDSDEFIKKLDANPYKVPTAVQQTLTGTLTLLARKLSE